MTMDIPFGGLPDSVSIPGVPMGTLPNSTQGSSPTSTNRTVVALGSAIPGATLPGVETVLIRISEQLESVLLELRTQNIVLHEALSGSYANEDLDQIRAGLLAADETITR